MLSEKIWKNIFYAFGFLSLAAVFVLMAFCTQIEIKDLDLWLHLKMGELIVHNGYVPEHDILSCSIAGKYWNNHEWLFQILLFYVNALWGPDGLLTMQSVVVGITFLLLLLLGYGRQRLLGVSFLLLLVLLVYEFRFTIRPDIFSLLFFTIYIVTLSLHIDRPWSVLALTITQVLWTNMHGFFFLGPLTVLIALFAEYTKRCVKLPAEWGQAGRLTDDEFRRLKWILLLVILACLVNPQTFKGAWYPISVMLTLPAESKIFFENIIELARPISMNTLFTEEYSFYKLFIFLSFISFVFNRRRIDLGGLILWIFFLFFSLAAVRNIVFFAFVGYFVCLSNFSGRPTEDYLPFQFSDRKFLYMTGIILNIVLIYWIMNYGENISWRGYFDYEKYERKSEYGGVSQRSFPHKAADFMVANQLKGNFFNDFNSGAYLIGRTAPNIKVFIDGRTEVYGAEFFRNYRTMWRDENIELLEKALIQYNITGAFLNSNNKEVPEKVIEYFWKHKEWVPVYFDYDGIILLKDIPQNQEHIAKLRLDLTTYRAPRVDLLRLGPIMATPYQEINRAYSYKSMGLLDLAIEEAEHARTISPGYIEAYKILGEIAGKKKEHWKAFENFRAATMINGSDTESRYNLALAYENLGEYKYAIKQYKKLVAESPRQPKAIFMLAKGYALDRQYQNAFLATEDAWGLDKNAVKDVLAIADIIFDQKEYPTALKIYLLLKDAPKNQAEILLKLGQVSRALGQEEQARNYFQQGLKIDPQNEVLKKSLSIF